VGEGRVRFAAPMEHAVRERRFNRDTLKTRHTANPLRFAAFPWEMWRGVRAGVLAIGF
jgi:hypothetical protein